ncbi:hypothetical protein EPO15_03665 [bacterium]|nr:MAG: hypothetical protein EPO15_03665 [bacterium]
MKYWVFNDARILGPYTREELSGIEAVHAGTLVCQEGTSGVADGDWRALEAVPELAGLAMAGAPAGGFAASSFSETLDPADAALGSGLPGFEDDPRFGFWMREEMETERSVEFARTLSEMREQMARHERRQDEILDRLNAKDAELVKREREISDLKARLNLYETGAARPALQPPAAAKAAPAPAPKPAAQPAPLPAAKTPAAPPPVEAPPPAPAAKAPEPPEMPPLTAMLPKPAPALAPRLEMESALEASAPAEAPLAPGEIESPARAAMRAARAAKKGLPTSSGPMEISLPQSAPPEMPAFAPPAEESFVAEALPALEAPAFGAPGDGIPESESLSPVAEMPPPLDFAPPNPEEMAQAAPPPLDAPPPFAEPPQADPLAPPPLSPFMDPAYQTQAQPQLPGQFNQPATVIFGGGGGLNLTPSPTGLGPSPFGSTPEPIPLGDPGSMSTPMPTMGQPDLPQTVMQGLGVGGQATPFPFGQQTPLPRLPGQQTSPFDAPITAAPRPLESSPGMPPAVPPTGAAGAKLSVMARVKDLFRSKKFVIVLGTSGLALAVILAMFLRNPKQLAKTVDMAPDHKAQGSFEENGPAPRTSAPSPFQKAPAAEAPPAAPEQPAPAPKPAAPAAKGKDYVSDGSVRAIEFVKNYKLDEARGTIGAYLQYAFLGPDTMPGWQAGAIEKDVWFVQYNVFKGAPGGRGAKPTYSFRFEVDLAKRTVKGVNPSAVEMLNPGGGGEKPKRKTRRRAPAGDSQEPLPGDDDLDGAPSGGAGFNNPGG